MSAAADLPSASLSGGAASLLAVEGLTKRFGGALALDNVSFEVLPGEVHGLLGQNGSGKSTLIKILAGFHAPEPGARLTVGGREVVLPLPTGGFRSLGIAFVHQHLALVPSMSVLENFLIGEHATALRPVIPWRREATRVRAVFDRFGVQFDLSAAVETLSSVERALLAILRAFDQLERAPGEGGVKLLILDEPTPFLPKGDVQHLFGLVRSLVREGASVVFVSHDIDEVLEITDRVTVLRDGCVAGTLDTHRASKTEIIRLIVGRDVDLEHMRPVARPLGAERARIEGLAGAGVGPVSLTLRHGEVVGLTGLIGSGYDSALHLLYGSQQAAEGRLVLDGEAIELAAMAPDRAIAKGIVLVPGDRLNEGAIGRLTVTDNITLPLIRRTARGWILRHRQMRRIAEELAQDYDVRPRDPLRLLGELSGGNQQKVVLAKWFQTRPRLILLEEPTQGVDIGAREQVFGTIRRMSEVGASVLCASSDHEQLAAICDRVVVFSQGRPVSEIAGTQISKSAIAALCYGAEGSQA